jgi:F0F1-type ATP synthase membrane subunit a
VLLTLMEIMIAGIQAFIFTIMTALFLGMYAEADH